MVTTVGNVINVDPRYLPVDFRGSLSRKEAAQWPCQRWYRSLKSETGSPIARRAIRHDAKLPLDHIHGLPICQGNTYPEKGHYVPNKVTG